MLRLYFFLFFLSLSLFAQDEPFVGLNLAIDGPSNKGRGILIVEDGYVIEAAHTCSGISCVGLIKTDFLGDLQWTQTYTAYPNSILHSINSVFQDREGYFIIPGVEYQEETDLDWFLMKLDENGDSLWKRKYAFQPNLFRKDIIDRASITSDEGYLLAGTTELSNEYLNEELAIYLIKTDKDGNVEWEKTHSYQDFPFYSILDVTLDIDNGFIISGAVAQDSIIGNYRGIFDRSYLLKIDSVGNVMWEKTYGYAPPYDNLWVRYVKVIPDGSGYIMTSAVPKDTVDYEWDSQELKKYYIARLDTEGEIVWQHNFEADNWKYINDLILTKDGNYVMGVGHNRDSGIPEVEYYSSGWMFKIDLETGELLWLKDYVSLEHLFVPEFDLLSLEEADNGTIVATGRIRDTIPDSEFAHGMVWLLTLDLEGCWEAGCQDSVVYLDLPNLGENLYGSSVIANVHLYPNPAQDVLWIEQKIEGIQAPFLKLYDALGELVVEERLWSRTTSISLTNLPTGMYFCQIQDKEGRSLYQEKVLIQR